jgi:hypothetical protein
MAPAAKEVVTDMVLSSSLFVEGFIAKANPSILQYIANVDGKKAIRV